MRAFVALPVPAAVRADLERFLEPRAEATPGWRWTPAENFHVTLAFLGDVAEGRLDRLEEALAEAAARSVQLGLELRGAGGFPDVARTKHLYQAVRVRDGDLGGLVEHVRHAAANAGCALQPGRYTAHVTVARTPRPLDATHLWRALDSYVSAPWTATECCLYRSELGRGRDGHPRYDPFARFPFATG